MYWLLFPLQCIRPIGYPYKPIGLLELAKFSDSGARSVDLKGPVNMRLTGFSRFGLATGLFSVYQQLQPPPKFVQKRPKPNKNAVYQNSYHPTFVFNSSLLRIRFS